MFVTGVECPTACFQESGLQRACAVCFGENLFCQSSDCLIYKGEAYSACLDRCDDDLLTCSGFAAPSPPSTPPSHRPVATPGQLPVSRGPCVITSEGCALSPGFPLAYPRGKSHRCTLSSIPATPLRLVIFDVEDPPYTYDGPYACVYDHLTVNGQRYCGSSGPGGVVPADGVITWVAAELGPFVDVESTSRAEQTKQGWKLCWGAFPPASPPVPVLPSHGSRGPRPPVVGGDDEENLSSEAEPVVEDGEEATDLEVDYPDRGKVLGERMAQSAADVRGVLSDAVQAGRTVVSIELPAGAHVTLEGAPLVCDGQIQLEIFSSGMATLDGGGESRILEITNGCSLRLRGLSLVNGIGQKGGAILLDGGNKIDIDESSFHNCSARPGNGGAVYAFNFVDVRIANTDFTRCSAGSSGGAIYAKSARDVVGAAGAVDVVGVRFDHCSADFQAGAIAVHDAHSLSVTASIFEHCQARRVVDATDTRAEDVWGGAILSNDVVLVSVERSTFGDCSATKRGGAMVARCAASVTSRLPCLLFVTGSSYKRCSAGERGGALSTAATSVNVSASSFESCFALAASSASQRGGALYSDARGGISSESEVPIDVTVTDSNFDGCFAGFTGKGSYSIPGNPPGTNDSVIGDRDWGVPRATQDISTFDVSGGGAVAVRGSRCTVRLDRSSFSGCSVGLKAPLGIPPPTWDPTEDEDSATYAGGAVLVEGTTIEGAAISAAVNTSLRVLSSNFTGCKAGGDGGALRTTATNVQMVASPISGCSAANGGGVYFESGIMQIDDCNIFECVASKKGGALYSASGTVTLSHRTLLKGGSAAQGSAVYVLSGEVDYRLPAPAGHWLPNARCEVYRKTCRYAEDDNKQKACLSHRDDCALTTARTDGAKDVEPSESEKLSACGRYRQRPLIDTCLQSIRDPWYCQEASFVQPCNWDQTQGGDPNNVGASLYQLPLLPVDGEFPFACSAGKFGPFSLTDDSAGSMCGGLCEPGTYGPEASESCYPCPAGTYSDVFGLGECIQCPRPLSNEEGSTTCAICQAGFFLLDSSASPDEVFRQPTEHCAPCPRHATCSSPGTTLASLGVPSGYWRASNLTAVLYRCDSASGACLGSEGNPTSSRRLDAAGDGATAAEPPSYCKPGHTGPLCELCIEEEHYLNDGECKVCPAVRWRVIIGLVVGASLGGIALLAVAYGAVRYARQQERSGRPGCMNRMRTWAFAVARAGIVVKLKVAISFYQVMSVFGTVYGIEVDPEFAHFFYWFDMLNFNVLRLIIPSDCISTLKHHMLISALWPFGATLLAAIALVVYEILVISTKTLIDARRPPSDSSPSSVAPPNAASMSVTVRRITRRCLRFTIFILFLMLPSVSRSIFVARQCEAFKYDDADDQWISFLVADPSMHCNVGPGWDNDSRSLDTTFWAFFALWPCAIPLIFLGLTVLVRQQRMKNQRAFLSKGCHFLWNGYRVAFTFWDVVDLWRKIFLTALVLFIDPEEGSNRFLRLIAATMVSALYLAALGLAQPYQSYSDFVVAMLSSLLLTCGFALSTVVKLCEKGRWAESCEAFTMLKDSYDASVLTVILSLTMVIFALIVVVFALANAAKARTIRLAATGRQLVLDLPRSSQFHLMVSHTWSTGQDAAHTLVRQLQLLLPGVLIWLDVDNLENVGRLEDSIASAAVVVTFLSAGYFKSANCRRELYATLAFRKPVVAVWEADKNKGGAPLATLEEECRQYCVDEAPDSHPSFSGPQEVLSAVFQDEPIQWARVNHFQVESIKAVVLRMLRHSSTYYSGRLALLDRGLTVPGEVGPVHLPAPLTLYTSSANTGARDLAKTLATAAAADAPTPSHITAAAVEIPEGSLTAGTAAGISNGSASRVAFLLHLNVDAFLDEHGEVAAAVKRALDSDVPVVMAHAQDPAHGGCPFGRFLDQTPRELQRPPYKLFDELAVPLYSSPVHRKTSLRLLLTQLGGTPVSPTGSLSSALAQLTACCAVPSLLSRLGLRQADQRKDASVAAAADVDGAAP